MTTASSVSRQLKAAGFGIVATRNREGIRVTRGALPGAVSVSVDLDRDREARRLADTLETFLVDAGWTFRRINGDLYFSITGTTTQGAR